jgi:hypothetical protein
MIEIIKTDGVETEIKIEQYIRINIDDYKKLCVELEELLKKYEL